MIARALGRSIGKMSYTGMTIERPRVSRPFASGMKDGIDDKNESKNSLKLPKGSTSSTVEKMLDRKSDVNMSNAVGKHDKTAHFL